MQCTKLHANRLPALLLRDSFCSTSRLSQQRSVSGCVCSYVRSINRLVEWVGSGAPVCEEHAEADSLEQAGQNTNGNSVERSLFSDNAGEELENVSVVIGLKGESRTYTWSSGSHEDQGTEVSGTLIAESTGGIDEGGNTVGLDTRSDERCTPAGGSGGSFTRLEELLAAVGGLGAMVGVTE